MVSIAVFLSFVESNHQGKSSFYFILFVWNLSYIYGHFVLTLFFSFFFLFIFFVYLFISSFLHFGKQFTSFSFYNVAFIVASLNRYCHRQCNVYSCIEAVSLAGTHYFCYIDFYSIPWSSVISFHCVSFYLFKVFLSISLFIFIVFFFFFVHSTCFYLNQLYTLLGHFIVWI